MPLKGGGTPFEASLLRLVPSSDRARGSYTYSDIRVKVGEAEFASRGGDEVEGAKRDVASKHEGLAAGEH